MTKLKDEIDLWNKFLEYKPYELIEAVGIAINMGMGFKRAEYILEKWADRGYIMYGISINWVWRDNNTDNLEEFK